MRTPLTILQSQQGHETMKKLSVKQKMFSLHSHSIDTNSMSSIYDYSDRIAIISDSSLGLWSELYTTHKTTSNQITDLSLIYFEVNIKDPFLPRVW